MNIIINQYLFAFTFHFSLSTNPTVLGNKLKIKFTLELMWIDAIPKERAVYVCFTNECFYMETRQEYNFSDKIAP